MRRCRVCGTKVVVHADAKAGGPGCPRCGENEWELYVPESAEENAP
jgi:predicted  nucleic acid-binding Zn-ribbon protein